MAELDLGNVIGPQGKPGETGQTGGYYKPTVSAAGELTWTGSKADMPDVEPVNIKGPEGKKGEPGKDAARTNYATDGKGHITITLEES